MSEYLLNFSEAEMAAIRAKYQDPALQGKALTDAECDGFVDMCRRYGGHPLRGQIIPLKFFDKDAGRFNLTFLCTIDMMRVAAHRSGAYAGLDDFEHDYSDAGSLLASRTKVWRLVQGHRCSFPGLAIWDEVYGKDAGKMPRKMPVTMLDKCAEASGLRRGFPLECGSLYLREEIRQIDPTDDSAPPPTARAVPVEPIAANGRDSGEQTPNAQKSAPAKDLKPKAWTRDMLIAMVGEWAKAAPELQLDITKGLIEAKGLKGVKPSDPRFQEFCAAVAAAIDRGETIERFANLPVPEPEPEPVRAPAAASAVEEF